MKVLKNDEALPSEIDSRAFFVFFVTETLRFQIIFVTLRKKIKHKDYEDKDTIQRQKPNDDEGENS